MQFGKKQLSRQYEKKLQKQLRNTKWKMDSLGHKSDTKRFHAIKMKLKQIELDKARGVIKPWPNGLASQRKSTKVFDLRSTCVSFGHPLASTCVDLGRLALTLVELKFARKSTQVFHRLATQRKSTQVDLK